MSDTDYMFVKIPVAYYHKLFSTENPNESNRKCENSNQLSNLQSFATSNSPNMAPLVEKEKHSGHNDMVMEHPDEQYTSTETNSSENNSDVQPDDEVNVRSKNVPLNHINEALRLLTCQDPRYYNKVPENKSPQISVPNGVVNPVYSPPLFGRNKLEFDGFYYCQKCDFVGRNDDELHEHAHKHDPYECGLCGFFSDTPDNVKMHLKAEHDEISASKHDDYIIFHEPEHGIEPEVAESTSKKKTKVKPFEENIHKPRKTLCRLCNNFTGNNKKEYYEHLEREHLQSGKLLHCNLCPFIGLYKHHLEYHLRNHYGSKPFQCSECDYKCVNKSMLNSHYKSHSDVYQYSCLNCQYMTKYLHSLKMHLRKYGHKHRPPLNPDGTVNETSVIDVNGKRRGPKSKKRKNESRIERERPKSKSSPSPPYFNPLSPSFLTYPSQNIRIMYNPHIHNNYMGNMCVRSGPSEAAGYWIPPPVPYALKCPDCEFVTGQHEAYQSHVLSHPDPKHPEYKYFQGPPGFRAESNSGNTDMFRSKQDIGNVGIGYNDMHFQNSSNKVSNYILANQKGPSWMETSAGVFPCNGQQNPRHSLVKKESPKEKLTKSLDVCAYKYSVDNGPLDLSIKPEKKSMSPEPKSRDIPSGCALPGGSMRPTVNGASSVWKNGKDDSKVMTQKTNRRKGRAFKLNQYTIESDTVSDDVETRVFYENTYPNHARSKPALNTAKWNGHSDKTHQFMVPQFSM